MSSLEEPGPRRDEELGAAAARGCANITARGEVMCETWCWPAALRAPDVEGGGCGGSGPLHVSPGVQREGRAGGSCWELGSDRA